MSALADGATLAAKVIIEEGATREQAITLVAIAGAESGYNPNAVGDTALVSAKWGPSIGLWQIRSLNSQRGTGGQRDALRLTDPAFNARTALALVNNRGNYRDWTMYNNGGYGKYMALATAAVDGKGVDDEKANAPSPLEAAVGAVGGVAVNAGGGLLSGIDAIGAFFSTLGQRGTWVRVLQVGGGAVAIVGGLALLGKDIAKPVAQAVASTNPVGRAAQVAGQVTKVSKGAAK